MLHFPSIFVKFPQSSFRLWQLPNHLFRLPDRISRVAPGVLAVRRCCDQWHSFRLLACDCVNHFRRSRIIIMTLSSGGSHRDGLARVRVLRIAILAAARLHFSESGKAALPHARGPSLLQLGRLSAVWWQFSSLRRLHPLGFSS